MRHLIFLFALALPLIGTAQRLHQNKELSQEERITLHVKKMQLALDLTEEQSKLLTEIFKKKSTSPTSKEKTGYFFRRALSNASQTSRSSDCNTK